MGARGRRGREFDEVFRQECRGVVRAAYLVVGDWEVAKEIAQDCFVELHLRWRRVGGYDDVGAWLRRIAVRRAVRVRDRDVRSVAFSSDRTNGPEACEQFDRQDEIVRLLEGLPRQQRASIVLHYLEDLPVNEIGPLIGCSTSTVKVHLHRARTAMRASAGWMEPGGVGDG